MLLHICVFCASAFQPQQMVQLLFSGNLVNQALHSRDGGLIPTALRTVASGQGEGQGILESGRGKSKGPLVVQEDALLASPCSFALVVAVCLAPIHA